MIWLSNKHTMPHIKSSMRALRAVLSYFQKQNIQCESFPDLEHMAAWQCSGSSQNLLPAPCRLDALPQELVETGKLSALQ